MLPLPHGCGMLDCHLIFRQGTTLSALLSGTIAGLRLSTTLGHISMSKSIPSYSRNKLYIPTLSFRRDLGSSVVNESDQVLR